MRFMSIVLAGLDFANSFIDDTLVSSKDWKSHLQHLRATFDRLRKFNSKLKPEKCAFCKADVNYLGHVVGKTGIKVDPAKVEKVKNWAVPTSKQLVKSFYGLCSYYRRYVFKFAIIAAPLTNLLRKDRKFYWTKDCMDSFETLKEKLCTAPVLIFPDFNKDWIIQTDASCQGIAGILSQLAEDECGHPVYYASRTLTSCERRYSVYEIECLAIVYSIKVFKPYIYGHHVVLETDHAPLKFLNEAEHRNNRIARWSLTLMGYDIEIRYKPGNRFDGIECQSVMIALLLLELIFHQGFVTKYVRKLASAGRTKKLAEFINSKIKTSIEWILVRELIVLELLRNRANVDQLMRQMLRDNAVFIFIKDRADRIWDFGIDGLSFTSDDVTKLPRTLTGLNLLCLILEKLRTLLLSNELHIPVFNIQSIANRRDLNRTLIISDSWCQFISSIETSNLISISGLKTVELPYVFDEFFTTQLPSTTYSKALLVLGLNDCSRRFLDTAVRKVIQDLDAVIEASHWEVQVYLCLPHKHNAAYADVKNNFETLRRWWRTWTSARCNIVALEPQDYNQDDLFHPDFYGSRQLLKKIRNAFPHLQKCVAKMTHTAYLQKASIRRERLEADIPPDFCDGPERKRLRLMSKFLHEMDDIIPVMKDPNNFELESISSDEEFVTDDENFDVIDEYESGDSIYEGEESLEDFIANLPSTSNNIGHSQPEKFRQEWETEGEEEPTFNRSQRRKRRRNHY